MEFLKSPSITSIKFIARGNTKARSHAASPSQSFLTSEQKSHAAVFDEDKFNFVKFGHFFAGGQGAVVKGNN